jgi:hypothetical protein
MRDLSGVIDLHLHTSPDLRPRHLSDIANTRIADSHGMAGILLKSHWFGTADRAILASEAANPSNVAVYGGLALNYSAGGLNPDGVEKHLRMGAKEVWMPTLDASHHRQYYGQTGGITLTSPADRSRLRPVVKQIVKLVAEHNAIVGTGHVSAFEIAALLRFAKTVQTKVLITHPEWPSTRLSLDDQLEFASLGAYFERCSLTVTELAGAGRLTVSEMVGEIRQIGVDTTVLASDLGIAHGPEPFVGYAIFLDQLRAEGVSEAELDFMTKTNPARLLNERRTNLEPAYLALKGSDT